MPDTPNAAAPGGEEDTSKPVQPVSVPPPAGKQPTASLKKPPEKEPTTKPALSPVSELPLPPAMRVGREFGLRLILIMAGALVLLVAGINISEWRRHDQFGNALTQAFGLLESSDLAPIVKARELVVAALAAPDKPSPTKEAAKSVFQSLAGLPEPSLNALAPCPATLMDSPSETRTSALRTCLLGLEAALTEARDFAPNQNRVNAVNELLRHAREANQDERSHWQQIAQMILLNLLLPLLTAVFGYVFGREQATKDSPSENQK